MNFIQKIRDYGFQKYMKEYYRESRDLWMSVTIAKTRELELMTKVADNWQAKLISAHKQIDAIHDDYANFVDEIEKEILADNIGKRLKFSVGHNHITIVVGNPTTYIQNVNFENNADQWNISRCSHKDSYDWKLGVIKALDNLCDEAKYSQKLRRDLRKALAKKYPEIFEATK